METEYIRSMNCNYERFLLEEKPEEKKYQYCMLTRGGIKGLLECSLRYINGDAYLYYDITSRQNIEQLFQRDLIGRAWLKDFMCGMELLGRELERFLLQPCNILWNPRQVFQDIERNEFAFVYMPYYEGESAFLELLSFFVEHIDYEDEGLVECVYRMYEQYEKNGDIYLQEKIFEDVRRMERKEKEKEKEKAPEKEPERELTQALLQENEFGGKPEEVIEHVRWEESDLLVRQKEAEKEKKTERTEKIGKIERSEKAESTLKGIRALFESKRNRKKESREEKETKAESNLRDDYREMFQRKMEGYAVAEDFGYEEADGLGQTVFLDQPKQEKQSLHRVYTKDGSVVTQLEQTVILIGKNKDKVDLYLDDASVSRLHAKIINHPEAVSIEDLNSTNGTFVNGARLQPYERKNLEPGDELKCGAVNLCYR